jgi:signal transduction histidine kinase
LDPPDQVFTRPARAGETITNLELAIVWQDGQHRDLLINSAPVLDLAGAIDGAIVIIQDISPLREFEKEMRASTAHIEMQHHLIQFREMERLHIAQDLHDGPLQDLIGVSFNLSEIINSAASQATGNETWLIKLIGVRDTLKQQIRDIRSFCSDLRPPTLIPFGLEKAIRSHVEVLQQRNPDLEVQIDLMSDGQQLTEKVRLAIFRVYQELLNNIVRHAQATRVSICFSLDDDRAFFEVIDNGCGFDIPTEWVELARQGHLGLVGIRERVEAIGGELTIKSTQGEGTQVRLSVPIS